MSVRASAPFSFFPDASGAPLSAGFVYIGVANQDPVSHPIAVFSDAALSVAVAQPIRTMAGVPVVNGTPVNLFVGGNYSMTVKDRNNVQVYTVPSAALAGGDITLASGETLEAQSGSTIDVKDGATVNLGDGTGAGVAIVVAATTRVTGDWVAADADNLGTSTERWGEAHVTTVLSPNNYGTNVTGFRDDTEPASPLLALGLNQHTNVIACGRVSSTGTIGTNHFNLTSATVNSPGNITVTLDQAIENDAVVICQPTGTSSGLEVRHAITAGGGSIQFIMYQATVLTSLNFEFVVIGRPRGGVANPIA